MMIRPVMITPSFTASFYIFLHYCLSAPGGLPLCSDGNFGRKHSHVLLQVLTTVCINTHSLYSSELCLDITVCSFVDLDCCWTLCTLYSSACARGDSFLPDGPLGPGSVSFGCFTRQKNSFSHAESFCPANLTLVKCSAGRFWSKVI